MASDENLEEELFGDADEDAEVDEAETVKGKKEKKDKKDKKDKKEKKEGKEKKEKKDKKEGKEKKEKKEEKEGKEKKEKKDKADLGDPKAVEAEADLSGLTGGKKEKRSKSKSKAKGRSDAAAQPAAEPEAAEPAAEPVNDFAALMGSRGSSKSGKETKEKKEKKEGKEKKEKKEKKDKKEKKEKKEKKRKAEGEPGAASDEEIAAEEAAVPTEERGGLDAFLGDVFGGPNTPNLEENEEDATLKQFDPEAEDAGEGVDDFMSQVFGNMGELGREDDTSGLVRVSHLPGRGRKEARVDKGPKAKGADKEVEEEAWPESFAGKFTKVLNFIKPMKALLIKEEDSHPYVQKVVGEMIEAADADLERFKLGQPMIRKMQMLPKALTVMQKHAFAEIFVTFDGCYALAKWLQCLPNGQLPNEHLRTELLNAMVRLPITKEALANCKDVPLGAVVKNLQLNPHETIMNRMTAGTLVQKWLSQVLRPASTLDLDQEEEEVAPKALLSRPLPETEQSLLKMEEEAAKHFRAAVPIIGGREYHVKPIPSAQPVRREKVALDTNRGKIGEVLKVMSRPNKRAWKPYSVSIAGRTVNADGS